MSAVKKFVAPLIVVALVLAAGLTLLGGKQQKTLTAHFPRAISIYEGSDVRVLGIPVGKVDTVTPSGTDVVVTMSYDPAVKIPADAKAVIIAPSIVGDRFIQLTPAYHGGAVLASGEVLDTDRTATPLELDQIYSSLDKLNVALGPDGANKKGALTDLLESTAANFGGQGAQFHQTIKNFSKLSATLDDNKEELFGSAEELEGFINTLARNDQTVRDFNQSLASVSTTLAGERQELRASLRNLGVALGQVSGFVKENRAVLSRNISGLNRVSKVLVKQRAALDEVAQRRPGGAEQPLAHLQPAGRHARHPRQQGELGDQIKADPAAFLCSIVSQADHAGSTCDVIEASQESAAARLRRRGAPRAAGPLRPDARRTRGGTPMTRAAQDPDAAARLGPGAERLRASTSTSCRSPVAPTRATTR